MAKQKKEKQKSTFWKDFKAFISRGNIIDLAVGLVVGAAFTAIVNSLVNDIIKPLIALLVGGNLSELAVILRPEEVNEAGEVIVEAITLNYGNLIMAILTFLIDAFVIFTAVRIVRNVQRRIREESEKLKLKLTQKENGETVETEAVVEEQAPAAPAEPPKPTVEELLAEIRDLLRENKAAAAADLAESVGKPEEKK
ncbi:MAG TPA: large conductance mechanosensitive channel protein MscL [Candidatus Borkfalkia avicola]|uniref:Large-conductance mechanosensitive channel n=1 Tax=Candidatus Borkfalkia avicola TaxID=2838503 RepID=A0A9D2D5U5_9FIRM|nr:large conductance mechanosensitive channel protein MscL [Candidatus Borkfalkia avicola]